MRFTSAFGLAASLLLAGLALPGSPASAQENIAFGAKPTHVPRGQGSGGSGGSRGFGGAGIGIGFGFMPPPVVFRPPPPVLHTAPPPVRVYRPERVSRPRPVHIAPAARHKPAVRKARAQPQARPQRAAPRQPVRGPSRVSGIPPVGENRFMEDEVVVRYRAGTGEGAIRDIAGWVRLEEIDRREFDLAATSVYRYRILGGRSVRQAIAALEVDPRVAFVQPNYLYSLQEMQLQALPAARPKDDMSAMQYALHKLRLDEAHGLARGRQVRVAVIDSPVDAAHPELNGAIVESFSALEAEGDTADAHGTGIAGVIAARGTLRGAAPDSQIVAVAAFREDEAGRTRGSSFDIARGLDFAHETGARLVNMSFAGPADPLLADMVKAALARKMILVAAAGNAGAASPPLYPAAYEGVIAVTATGADDSAFRQANAGAHIALAAPGVDILAPAPEASYQVASGTSLAAAHVSGLIALMLERQPQMSGEEAVAALASAAVDLGEPGRDERFGSGLPQADRALAAMPRRLAAGR
ncbi:S8 family serine peptidase [Afifella pfennigii]|uniref:S8 family serine peptidase n=1 Tax=Afifella pfennigii TaxID=209897 RepID=UPI0006912DE5|nr:S8 family serine peptidase [Afifella pfennigii]